MPFLIHSCTRVDRFNFTAANLLTNANIPNKSHAPRHIRIAKFNDFIQNHLCEVNESTSIDSTRNVKYLLACVNVCIYTVRCATNCVHDMHDDCCHGNMSSEFVNAGCMHCPQEKAFSGQLVRGGVQCPRCLESTAVILLGICPYHRDITTQHERLCRRCCAVAMSVDEHGRIWQPQQCYNTVLITMLVARVLEQLHDAITLGKTQSSSQTAEYAWTLWFHHSTKKEPQRWAVLEIAKHGVRVCNVCIQMYTSTYMKTLNHKPTHKQQPTKMSIKINILDLPRVLRPNDILLGLCAARNSRVVSAGLLVDDSDTTAVEIDIHTTHMKTALKYGRKHTTHHCKFAEMIPHSASPRVLPMHAWRSQYGCCICCGIFLHPPSGDRVGLTSKYFLAAIDNDFEEEHYAIENLASIGTLATDITTGVSESVLTCATCRSALQPFASFSHTPRDDGMCVDMFEYLRRISGMHDLAICALHLCAPRNAQTDPTEGPVSRAPAAHKAGITATAHTEGITAKTHTTHTAIPAVAFFSNMRRSITRDISISPIMLDKHLASVRVTDSDNVQIFADDSINYTDYVCAYRVSLASQALEKAREDTNGIAWQAAILFGNTYKDPSILGSILGPNGGLPTVSGHYTLPESITLCHCDITASTKWVVCRADCNHHKHKRNTLFTKRHAHTDKHTHTHTHMFQVCAVLNSHVDAHESIPVLVLPRARDWDDFDLNCPTTRIWDEPSVGFMRMVADYNDFERTASNSSATTVPKNKHVEDTNHFPGQLMHKTIDITLTDPTQRSCWIYRRMPLDTTERDIADFVSPQARAISPLLDKIVDKITTVGGVKRETTSSEYAGLMTVAGTMIYHELRYLMPVHIDLQTFLYIVWKKYVVDHGFVATNAYTESLITHDMLLSLHVSLWAHGGMARHIAFLLHGTNPDPELLSVFSQAQIALSSHTKSHKRLQDINTLDDMLRHTRHIERIAFPRDECINGYTTHKSLMNLHYLSHVFPRSISYKNREIITALRVGLSTRL